MPLDPSISRGSRSSDHTLDACRECRATRNRPNEDRGRIDIALTIAITITLVNRDVAVRSERTRVLHEWVTCSVNVTVSTTLPTSNTLMQNVPFSAVMLNCGDPPAVVTT